VQSRTLIRGGVAIAYAWGEVWSRVKFRAKQLSDESVHRVGGSRSRKEGKQTWGEKKGM